MAFSTTRHSHGTHDTPRLGTQSTPGRQEAWRTRAFIRRMVAMVLAQQGLAGASLTAIARAIHMPVRNLAYHYPTLETLLAAVAGEHVADLSGAVCVAFDASANAAPSARLTTMLLALIEAIDRDPDVHAAAAMVMLTLPSHERADTSLRWQGILAMLAEPLVAASPALARRPRLATALLQCVMGGYADARPFFAGEDGLDLLARARRLTAMLMAAAGAEHEGCCGTPSKACALAWLLSAAGDVPETIPVDPAEDAIIATDDVA